MSLHLSLVPDPKPGEGGPLDVAVISDRIGWEEKAILGAARAQGAKAEWLNDGELCCGSREDLRPASTYLIRSRSFVRGPLIAETIAGDSDRRVINPASVIGTCSNKVTTLATLRQVGLPTVPYRLVLTRKDLASALAVFGCPMVLKPVFGGLGRRVMLVRELAVADSMYDYVEHYAQNFDRALIAQPYLEGATDVRVLVVDGEPVAAMERVPGDDWRANVELGAEGHPIEVDESIRTLAADVGERIGAKVYGLDLFRWDGALIVGEVNHSPMFKGIVEATGIDVGELIANHALGILGGELLRLLAGHPGLEIEYVSAQSRAGRPATELNPHLKDAGIGDFETFDAKTAAKRCDVVFLATPPETAGKAVPELLDAGAELVVDLSPAYRVRDPDRHREWYADVERDQEVADGAVYGLPELNREALGQARVIAMPGCFATAILLAALPLREVEGVSYDAMTVDGKSGSTGSGARLRESGAHTWRANVVAPYAPRGHRHVAEVVQAMGDHGIGPDGRAPKLGMTTYGVDLVRGLSVGLYAFFEGELDERALRRAYHRTYRDERFVRVQVGRGSALPLPDPKAVIGSNYCDVAPFVDESSGRFVLISAIDNMVKGGAGQAVQACNVRLGLPEDQGLEAIPVFPV